MNKKLNRILLIITTGLAGVTALISILRPAIYRPFTAPDYLAESTGQDIFTLLLALILLSFLSLRRRKGGEDMSLISIGCIWYFFYAFSIYGYGSVYTPLFFNYVAVMGLSLVVSILIAAEYFKDFILEKAKSGDSDYGRLNSRKRRLFPAFFLIVSSLLIGWIWCSSIISHIINRTAARETVIYVNDLSVVLPAFFITGVLLLKKRRAGLALGNICLVKAVTIGFSIIFGQGVKWFQGLEMDYFLAGFFTVFTIAAAAALKLSGTEKKGK